MRKIVSETRNAEIKKLVQRHGVYLWEVAAELGMKDSNFSRMLRYELSEKEKNRIIQAVHKIVAERDAEA